MYLKMALMRQCKNSKGKNTLAKSALIKKIQGFYTEGDMKALDMQPIEN